MPIERYLSYYRSMDTIIADEMLRKLEVATFPSLKQDKRKEIFDKYSHIVAPKGLEGQRFEDAFKELSKWQMKR